jgi:hypothetical protein
MVARRDKGRRTTHGKKSEKKQSRSKEAEAVEASICGQTLCYGDAEGRAKLFAWKQDAIEGKVVPFKRG